MFWTAGRIQGIVKHEGQRYDPPHEVAIRRTLTCISRGDLHRTCEYIGKIELRINAFYDEGCDTQTIGSG